MAAAKGSLVKVGSWSFIIGILIAIIAGIVSPGGVGTAVTSLLIVLGLIVGFLNVTSKETTAFLLATISLVIVSSFGGAVVGQVVGIGPYLKGVLAAILVFVIPATIIVALKSVYALASEE